MFKNIWNQILAWLTPLRIFPTLSNVLDLWRTSDTKDRGLLLIVFFPMLLCLGGMSFSLISFMLFVLPSFVVKMFMWGALVMLFNFVGSYGFEHLTGRKTSTSTDANKASSDNNKSASSDASSNNFDFTDVSFTDNCDGDNAGASDSDNNAGQRDSSSDTQTDSPFQKWYKKVRGEK